MLIPVLNGLFSFIYRMQFLYTCEFSLELNDITLIPLVYIILNNAAHQTTQMHSSNSFNIYRLMLNVLLYGLSKK